SRAATGPAAGDGKGHARGIRQNRPSDSGSGCRGKGNVARGVRLAPYPAKWGGGNPRSASPPAQRPPHPPPRRRAGPDRQGAGATEARWLSGGATPRADFDEVIRRPTSHFPPRARARLFFVVDDPPGT